MLNNYRDKIKYYLLNISYLPIIQVNHEGY